MFIVIVHTYSYDSQYPFHLFTLCYSRINSMSCIAIALILETTKSIYSLAGTIIKNAVFVLLEALFLFFTLVVCYGCIHRKLNVFIYTYIFISDVTKAAQNWILLLMFTIAWLMMQELTKKCNEDAYIPHGCRHYDPEPPAKDQMNKAVVFIGYIGGLSFMHLPRLSLESSNMN